jgi:hypothetical protein
MFERAITDPLQSYGPSALKAAATTLETIRMNLTAHGCSKAAPPRARKWLSV